jgi:hypothetical protein
VVDAARIEEALARPVQEVGEVEVGDILEPVTVLRADVEHFPDGDELRLIVPHVPAVAGRDDHDLAELVIVDGKAILRAARLDGDSLRSPPKPVAGGKLHGARASYRERCGLSSVGTAPGLDVD